MLIKTTKFPVIVIPALRVQGMAIFPFIILKNPQDNSDLVLIRHETIHLRQQLEMLIIPFYIAYIVNYIYNLALYHNHIRAYQEIIFEREAFSKEDELDYLTNRKLWAFLRYLE